MGKPNVRKDITEAKAEIKSLMSESLAVIAGGMIQQIMARARALPSSRVLEALNNFTRPGVGDYRSMLKSALAVIALEAIEKVRREVPKAKSVRLSEHEESIQLAEFDRLPLSVQKRLLAQSQILVETQMGDLEKAIMFQFTGSADTTDSMDVLQKDIEDSAEDFINGSSVDAAAGNTASKMINEARQAFFFDDEVLDQVEAFQFTNGDPVSPICQDLAGTIFAKDDPEADRYYPPLHHNCKSYLVAILTGQLGSREITALKPSKASLEKSITLAELGPCPACSCG